MKWPKTTNFRLLTCCSFLAIFRSFLSLSSLSCLSLSDNVELMERRSPAPCWCKNAPENLHRQEIFCLRDFRSGERKIQHLTLLPLLLQLLLPPCLLHPHHPPHCLPIRNRCACDTLWPSSHPGGDSLVHHGESRGVCVWQAELQQSPLFLCWSWGFQHLLLQWCLLWCCALREDWKQALSDDCHSGLHLEEFLHL